MKIYVDIDGTICNTLKVDGKWDYKSANPIQAHIDKINKLYYKGNEIVYWTARGSNTGIDWLEFTADQLDSWGCQYHELICGKDKGAFDMIIDDKAFRIEEIESKKIGFTCGSFDLLHPGHVMMLEDCKNICDYLIAAVQIDPTLDRKDKNIPIQSIDERVLMTKSIKYVDEVRTYTTEQELYDMLVEISPDVRIVGSDWKGNPNFTGGDLDIQVYYHDRNHNHSTTNLRKKVFKAENK